MTEDQKTEEIQRLVQSTREIANEINSNMAGIYASAGMPNVLPVIGSGVDLARVSNAFSRGQFGRGTGESFYYLAGAFGDLFSGGTAGTGLRSGRQTRLITRLIDSSTTLRGALNTMDSSTSIRRLVRTVEPIMDSIINARGRIFTAMILLDTVRAFSPLFIPPRLGSKRTINNQSLENEFSRDDIHPYSRSMGRMY